MKTILEWLETIPNEDTRIRAIANYDPHFSKNEPIIPYSLSDALCIAFSWKGTPEKIDF